MADDPASGDEESPPHTRGRGLKYRGHGGGQHPREVAPSHEGAWIEIGHQGRRGRVMESPPHTRGRGLKFGLVTLLRSLLGVAPSHEGAWIEMSTALPAARRSACRPLTRGGVD